MLYNIIDTNEACLYYNNHEFCFGPNYWVETGNGGTNHQSTENGVASKNKLQSAMEAALGLQVDRCSSSSDSANCYVGDFYCGTSASGNMGCRDAMQLCVILSDSTATCMH